MKNLLYIFALCIPLVLAFASCEIINPEEEIPSYVRIDSFAFHVQTGEGSMSHMITDAWVYIDGEKCGVYELPCTFPVLYEGQHTIEILPGIKLNGISATRGIYPFYTHFSTTTDLIKDSIIIIKPECNYQSAIVFELIEDFESGGILFDEMSTSDTTLERTSDPSKVFEGMYSGYVVIDNAEDLFMVKTINAYDLPQANQYNFLELNFKTNNSIYIGVIGNEPSQSIMHPILVLNPTDVWKKIYINLTPTISRETDAIDFNIFIGAELDDGNEKAEIFIDNIKLIHPE